MGAATLQEGTGLASGTSGRVIFGVLSGSTGPHGRGRPSGLQGARRALPQRAKLGAMAQQPPVGPQPGTAVPAPPPGWQPATSTAPPTNTLAVVSMAAGIASFVFVPFIGAVVAIVTGHMAKHQIRATGEAGSGFATLGLILGYVHMALFILVVIAVLVFLGGLGLFFATHSR